MTPDPLWPLPSSAKASVCLSVFVLLAFSLVVSSRQNVRTPLEVPVIQCIQVSVLFFERMENEQVPDFTCLLCDNLGLGGDKCLANLSWFLVTLKQQWHVLTNILL